MAEKTDYELTAAEVALLDAVTKDAFPAAGAAGGAIGGAVGGGAAGAAGGRRIGGTVRGSYESRAHCALAISHAASGG